MNAPSSVDDLIAMSKKAGRLKSVNKDVIADILENAPPLPAAATTDLMEMMINEMKQLRESNERVIKTLDRVEKVEKELEEMKEENATMHQIIWTQQRFLEGLDAKERQCMAVFLGMKEDEDLLGRTDEERLETVLGAILDVSNLDQRFELKRLGKGSRRPLLVTFMSKADRDTVITNAKKLKDFKGTDQGKVDAIKRIFIKKDQHPVWRKEHDRLRKVVKEEKGRPENQGTKIEYDHKLRVVTRDGLVIDSFKPVFQ